MDVKEFTGVDYSRRVIDREVENLIKTVPAIVIEGPRGCGKTMTGLNFARSAAFLDSPETELLAATDLSLLTEGENPRLLDEWQLYPALWNVVRRKIDFGGSYGSFILTGSAVPNDDVRRHSGAGRFIHLRQRTMTGFEKSLLRENRGEKSPDDRGEVSLRGLFAGEGVKADTSSSAITDVISQLLTPGFPNMVLMEPSARRRMLEGYIQDISEVDIQRLADVRHDPHSIRALLASLSRHVSTSVSWETLRKDLRNVDVEISVKGVQRLIELLERMYVVESVPAMRTQLRSRAVLRKSSKFVLADPALAAAALYADEEALLADMETTGFLFESAVIHDLAVFAQALEGNVGYYRDSNNHEIDCVIELENGAWAAIEVKLGLNQIEYGAERLSLAVEQIDKNPPAFKAVVTGNGPILQLKDGTFTFPLHALRP